MPPHTIEYQEPKGKGEVCEDKGPAEEEDEVVNDIAFHQSGTRHDDRGSSTMDRHPGSGKAIGLPYCPSSDSLRGPSMVIASHEELLSSSVKHKKQALKAQLNKAKEAGQEGFRSQGSTMAHMYEALKAEPKKLELPQKKSVKKRAKPIGKVMAKQEGTDTQPKSDGKKGRSASGGYFAFKNLARGSIRSSRVFEE